MRRGEKHAAQAFVRDSSSAFGLAPPKQHVLRHTGTLEAFLVVQINLACRLSNALSDANKGGRSSCTLGGLRQQQHHRGGCKDGLFQIDAWKQGFISHSYKAFVRHYVYNAGP